MIKRCNPVEETQQLNQGSCLESQTKDFQKKVIMEKRNWASPYTNVSNT